MNHLRPNHERARTAVALIWVMFALGVVSLVSGYFQYKLLTDAASGITITEEAANANDSRERMIGIIYLIANIISAITFIMWFRRAYFNLHLIDKHLKFSEGWAAGCWFVPFVNWFRPYNIMQEMYETTKRLLSDRQSTSFVGWWWAFWLLASISGSISFQFARNATTVDDYITYTIFDMVQSIFLIPAAILTVKVIRYYSAMEDQIPEVVNKIEEPQTSSVSA